MLVVLIQYKLVQDSFRRNFVALYNITLARNRAKQKRLIIRRKFAARPTENVLLPNRNKFMKSGGRCELLNLHGSTAILFTVYSQSRPVGNRVLSETICILLDNNWSSQSFSMRPRIYHLQISSST